jgi:hypothetical protein
MLYKLAAKLTALKQDRGEGPVPYIILVAVIAAVAVAVGAGVSGVATKWITELGTVK